MKGADSSELRKEPMGCSPPVVKVEEPEEYVPCDWCGSTDHDKARQCPVWMDRWSVKRGRGRWVVPRPTCFVCGDWRHWKRDCPQAPRGCFVCGSPDHLKRECPQRGKMTPAEQRRWDEVMDYQPVERPKRGARGVRGTAGPSAGRGRSYLGREIEEDMENWWSYGYNV